MGARAAACSCSTRSDVTITNSTFSGNERDDVRVAQDATATIIGSTFIGQDRFAGQHA